MTNSGKWAAQSIFQGLQAPIISKLAIIISQAVLIPPFVSILSFLCTKAQVILILVESTLFALNKSIDGFMEFLHSFHEIVFLQRMLFRDSTFVTCAVVLSLCLVHLVLLIVLSCHLSRTIYKNSMPSKFFMTFWSITMKIQLFLAFYPINLMSIRALSLSSSDSFNSTQVSSTAITILSLAVLVLNAIWSLLIILLFTIKVKAKDILSAKTSRPDLVDLLFKFVMPFLWVFGVYSEAISLIILIINVIYCGTKVLLFFSFFPYYSVPLLKVDGFFKAAISSFASAGLLYKIVSYKRYSDSLHHLVLLWIMLLCCYFAIIHQQLNALLRDILLNPTKIRNPYHLIHYFEIFKSFERYSTPGLASLKTKHQYMTYIAAIKNSEMSHLLPSETNLGWTTKTQDQIHQYFYKKNMTLLETAMKKHPRMVLLKIVLAYYYKKFEGLWPLVHDILDNSSKSSFFMRNSVYLVKLTILNKIKPHDITFGLDQNKLAQIQKRRLEIHTYFDLIESWKRVKASLSKQLQSQTDFWKEFQAQKPDFFRLKELAKAVYSKATAIKPLSTQYKVFSEHGFYEPLLTLGLYFCFAQNGLEAGQKLIIEYCKNKSLHRNIGQREMSFTVNEHILESIYLVMSVSPHQLGTILDCSGKIKSTLGLEKDVLIGRSINSLMPLIYAKSHDDFLKLSYKNEEQKAHQEVQEVLILSYDGYIIPCRIDLAINYLPNYGICYSTLLRPSDGKTRVVLIQDDGKISNFSWEFQQDMGIQKNKFDEKALNIFDYCPDLRKTLKKFKVLVNRTILRAVSFFKTPKADAGASSFQAKLSSISKRTSDISNEDTHPDKETNQKAIQTETFEAELIFSPEGFQSEPITYKTEIRKVAIQNYHVIELKMERIIPNQNNAPKPSPSRFSTRQTTGFSKLDALYINAESQFALHSPKLETVRMDTSEGLLPLQSPNLNQKVKFTFSEQSERKLLPQETESGMLISPKVPEKRLSMVSDMESMTEYSHLDAAQNKKVTSTTQNPLALNSDIFEEVQVLNKKNLTGQIIPTYDYIESNLLKETLGEGYADKSTSYKLDNVSGIRAYKLANSIIESKKLKPATWGYTLFYVAIFICLVAFLICMNIYLSVKSQEVETTGQVLTQAYFRNLWTKYSNQETRIFVAVLEDIYPFLIAVSIGANLEGYQQLSVYNQNLKQSLNNLDYDIAVRFFEKNVRLYEKDANQNLVILSTDDTFQAIDKIVNNGLTNAQKPLPRDAPYPEADFIFDNSFNDLLITSEALISVIQEHLFDILQITRNNLTAFLIIIVCALGIFFIASFFFIKNSNRESQHFMEILFGIPLKDIRSTGTSLSKFKELIETEASSFDLLQNFRLMPSYHVKDLDQQEHASGIGASRKKVFREASMKKYDFRNYLIFGGLFVALGFMVVFSLIYYLQAVDRIASMESQHTSMYSTLTYANTVTLSSLETQALLMGFSTSKIKNLPVTEVLSGEIEKLRGVDALRISLQDEHGALSEGQYEILFNISCDRVYSANYNIPDFIILRDCNNVSKGLGRVGLTDVMANLASTLVEFQTEFINGPKDAATIKTQYNTFFDAILPIINTGSSLLLKSYEITIEEFVSLTEDLGEKSIALAWVALVFSVALGIVTWIFVINKLLDKELERKKILALVPIKLILPNYGIKKYILDLPR